MDYLWTPAIAWEKISAMSIRIFPLIGLLLPVFLSGSELAAQSASSTSASAASSRPPYWDPSLPLEQRVNDLVSRMTLEEKVSQMQDVAPAIPRLGISAYNWWNEGLHGVAPVSYTHLTLPTICSV